MCVSAVTNCHLQKARTHAYAPAAQEMATSGLVRWDRVCPPRHDGIIHAVIARIPQGPKRSLGPLAPGSPHDIPPTQSAPPVGAGRFAERASAYWITRRCTKVWSPAVTFTKYMPWAMEASRAITVFRVLPFTAMVRVVTL